MGTYDGYWEMAQTASQERNDRLQNEFWMIRDNSGRDVCKPKQHDSEADAWKSVIVAPFGVPDYKAKGYTAVKVDVRAHRREIDLLKSRNYI